MQMWHGGPVARRHCRGEAWKACQQRSLSALLHRHPSLASWSLRQPAPRLADEKRKTSAQDGMGTTPIDERYVAFDVSARGRGQRSCFSCSPVDQPFCGYTPRWFASCCLPPCHPDFANSRCELCSFRGGRAGPARSRHDGHVVGWPQISCPALISLTFLPGDKERWLHQVMHGQRPSEGQHPPATLPLSASLCLPLTSACLSLVKKGTGGASGCCSSAIRVLVLSSPASSLDRCSSSSKQQACMRNGRGTQTVRRTNQPTAEGGNEPATSK